MNDEKEDGKEQEEEQVKSEKMCNFAPDEKDASEDDAILYRKTRNVAEWIESSERCLRHVTERLDQIEEEINQSLKDKK